MCRNGSKNLSEHHHWIGGLNLFLKCRISRFPALTLWAPFSPVELSSSELQEGREEHGECLLPRGAGLSPGLCSGPPSIQWDGTITFHFLGPCILGCGQQPFSVSIRSIWNLMWAAWTLDLTGCCPACRVGINNMAQCGLAVCLWYQELVVTQETCQPLSKPDAQVTSFQTTSHESVWNSAVNSVRSSLYFLGGWKPGLNFCHH